MSTSDDQRNRDTDGDDKDRDIAIPGYRRVASEGPRHRPPSVQRTESAGRVRSTGSQRAVHVTGSPKAVRATGSQKAVRATGSQRAVRVTGSQKAASASVRQTGRSAAVKVAAPARAPQRKAETRRPAASSGKPAPGAAVAGRASVDPTGAGGATPASVGEPAGGLDGPRGIDELQAELAQDDIRLMARQIARGGVVESPRAKVPAADRGDRFAGLVKWRSYIAAGLIIAALAAGLPPILSTSGARSTHAELASAVQQAARAVGGAAAPGAVAGWIGDRDLQALKTFYGAQRPRVLEALHSAGFDDIGPGGVSIRVNFDASTLVIGARVDDGDGGQIVVAADLSGELVGRKPPPGGLGPAFDEKGGLLLSLLAGAIAACSALWAIPMLAGRRRTP